MNGCRRDPERAEVRALRRWVPLRGARILEIGCGNGRLTRRIARLARAILATDPNADQIARARALTTAARGGSVRYRVASGEALRVPRRRFDVAIFSWSL
jgi:ubiquinone/menaquinone biosynthesis C-methylase UbiE